jgi:DNA helicase-2/ATP-dependent DNA helicase PcrA
MQPVISPLFRPSQYAVLNYRGGKTAISAVPGSGKTFILSHMAARLVERLSTGGLTDDQEVLVVTFANSAVNSFKSRIADIMQRQRGLLPYVGYRVRTLHGLAHDIVRERPSLVGLAEDFTIIDERLSAALKRETVDEWLRSVTRVRDTATEDWLNAYIDPEAQATPKNANRIRFEEIPDMATAIADGFIRQAKDQLLTPADLRAKLEDNRDVIPLARFGVEVYEAYQRSLTYRGAVDFDDLVRLALSALETDEAYLKRLQKRWPYILEDEAQDSSQLQERMLRLLSGNRNWIRVGDPNQAINTTFTTADPKYLREFSADPEVSAFTLAEAGRSARPILDLANTLVDWAIDQHPVPELRSAFVKQHIQPTPPGDQQPNPPAEESRIYIHYQPGTTISPEKELDIVASSLQKWLPDHPERSVAVLVPENSRGFKLAELLRRRGVDYEELLRSTTATRDAAGAMRAVLAYLENPIQSAPLGHLYRDVWWPIHLGHTDPETDKELLAKLRDQAVNAIVQSKRIEMFLYPEVGVSPMEALEGDVDSPEAHEDIELFRQHVVRWLDAIILPIDQLMLTIGQDLFHEATDIALNYKLAQLLRGMGKNNPDWRLPQFAEELRAISQNERKFLGFDDAEHGYTPHPGRVTIATMHAAKGLEWDRVYLMAVNNYSFPSAQPFDDYISEKWFIRDHLNMDAEMQAQMASLVSGIPYHEGAATQAARIAYAAERLRLLYVGITRAKRELIITWNTGRPRADKSSSPSLPLVALSEVVKPT